MTEEELRKPVADLETLDALDERDLISGYWAGFKGDGHAPSVEMDTAYYHGWVNGMCDSGRMKPSGTHRKLVSDWLERERGISAAKP